MKEYALLRYGESLIEPVYAAIIEDGDIIEYAQLTRDRKTREIAETKLGLKKPQFTMNDVENSWGTDAERALLLGKRITGGMMDGSFSDPTKLATPEDVMELVAYENTLRIIATSHYHRGLEAVWSTNRLRLQLEEFWAGVSTP